MNTLGQFLLLSGIVLAIIGTWTVYTSLRIYSDCAVGGVCTVTSRLYLQFLDTQTLGNTMTIFGAACLSMGAVFFTSAQARMPVQAQEEEPVKVAQTA